MNYQETLDYLFSRLPMYTRDGAVAIKNDLTNTLALTKLLGDPHKKIKFIHVAGTNGKGSSSHALASILQQSGYRTGLYTSPHLVDFRERIRVNGEMIPEDWVIEFVKQYQNDIEHIKPSFFETTVAMALSYFEQQEVDIAVIETGLGGRLDSTNVITPEISLITNIGWDHADILGGTLEQIAREKSGIIKHKVPVVVSEYQETVAHVFQDAASKQESTLTFASLTYHSRSVGFTEGGQRLELTHAATGAITEHQTDLQGNYQAKNLPGILCVVEELQKLGWKLSEDQIRAGLKSIQGLTGLRGRWEILNRSPLLVCDTGHNADGWKEIIQNINLTPHRQLHMVLGIMRDKDTSKMLPILPKHANYYFCQVNSPRALPAAELAAVAKAFNLNGLPYPTVKHAVDEAMRLASKDDLVFVGGSTFIVGDLLNQ